MLLQKDFIEPGDINLPCYSFRIQEIFIRTCIELEANFRNIFRHNKYTPLLKDKHLSVEDYFKINSSRYLSGYSMKLPYWGGDLTNAVRQPFKSWHTPTDPDHPWALKWYRDYNRTKHDRASNLSLANFENLVDTICALAIVITSQYMFEDFSPAPSKLLLDTGRDDGFEPVIGEYFRVCPSNNTSSTKIRL